jgi:hypothetical protein
MVFQLLLHSLEFHLLWIKSLKCNNLLKINTKRSNFHWKKKLLVKIDTQTRRSAELWLATLRMRDAWHRVNAENDFFVGIGHNGKLVDFFF